jgi:hypothetical protein
MIATSNADFRQMVLDFFSITTQRHEEIMTSNQDVMNAIAAHTTALAKLDTTIKTAISDMGTGGDAARAGFVTALTDASAKLATMETELTAAIAAVTSPPAAPAA